LVDKTWFDKSFERETNLSENWPAVVASHFFLDEKAGEIAVDVPGKEEEDGHLQNVYEVVRHRTTTSKELLTCAFAPQRYDQGDQISFENITQNVAPATFYPN
jgi:hypothetical protein